MNCSEAKKYLTDYVLEELDPELQIQVNEHLAICKKCAGQVLQTAAVIDSFKDSARFKPTPGVYGRITDQIRVPKPERSRIFGMPRSLVFALGAFLFGIVVTRSIDFIIMNVREPSSIEVRQEAPRKVPFSDTVEFYSVPAKNLARI
ncbi:MAG: zf-HC2 domain-containing protein [bacterium]